MVQLAAPVIENVRLARDTYRVRLQAPALAASIRPGQFVMLRLPDRSDPLLGRPFALYDTAQDAIDVVYLVVGKMTSRLSNFRAGDKVEMWGPLGNGFNDLSGHVGLVAGGIGQTPFLAYIRHLLGTRGYGGQTPQRKAERVSLYYGVRTADLAAGIDDFRNAGAEVHVASDDGSLGYRGYVTQLLAEKELPNHLVGCGPEPMLHALSRLAKAQSVPCDVSLETPMACGVGICFSCVVKVKTGDTWDYKRCCVDGPIFDAGKLVWE
ncbi:MAG: dihydroorotate dehydrogenase electron transfer subunit [Planctomycetia bacterium]|nr:dihydroorotate dehydrogenase electron transfer subunit [Planctomycetia bacterium]